METSPIMKNLKYLFVLFIPLFCNFQCGKDPNDVQQPPAPPVHCSDCAGNIIASPDVEGSYAFLPNAFTPNGDGKNDYLRFVSANIQPGSFNIEIYNEKQDLVGMRGVPDYAWDGKDMGGAKMPAGDYPVKIRYKTRDGREVNTCTCIKLLEYNIDGCIVTHGQQLYFEDQLDTQNGFIYDTGETLCK